ncbi:MAG: riboflavin biosynthesis protein RibF [Candidatus Epulonipiscioides saccharophilum]|nr:MAG: riboflavin biosynthesis protein RibF [Epulopiscium sp. AS2M-Bin001]
MRYVSNAEKIVTPFGTAIALGNFDGVHLGHQKLFEMAMKEKGNLELMALSFYPHPTWVLNGVKKDIITSRQHKRALMEKLGVDIFVEYPFTLDLANMNAYDFFRKILIENLNAKMIIVGQDYKFGKARQAGIAELESMCKLYNIKLLVVEKLIWDKEKISSTQIRQYLLDGDIEKANKLLGYPYKLSGKIIKGNQIGRTIGFKTANILTKHGIIYPKNGVYATKVKVYNKDFLAITNIGYNPTINDKIKIKMVETNIFDFDVEIYDENIEVSFFKFIRPEKKFESLADLKRQITSDKEKTQEYFTNFARYDILAK